MPPNLLISATLTRFQSLAVCICNWVDIQFKYPFTFSLFCQKPVGSGISWNLQGNHVYDGIKYWNKWYAEFLYNWRSGFPPKFMKSSNETLQMNFFTRKIVLDTNPHLYWLQYASQGSLKIFFDFFHRSKNYLECFQISTVSNYILKRSYSQWEEIPSNTLITTFEGECSYKVSKALPP